MNFFLTLVLGVGIGVGSTELDTHKKIHSPNFSSETIFSVSRDLTETLGLETGT